MPLKALKAERIEAKPKRVIIHDEFTDECGVGGNAHLLLQFNELQDCIANGVEVPDEFYRLDVGKNRDALLQITGVKHLHLGGRGSDVLVYLIECDDRVFILRIADHDYLQDQPRGHRLFAASQLPYPFQR